MENQNSNASKVIRKALRQLWVELDERAEELKEVIGEYQGQDGTLNKRSVETIKELVNEFQEEIADKTVATRVSILKDLGESKE